MDKTILVPIAHGVEETEAVTIIDLLRRAKLHVTVAGDAQVVIGSRGVHINPDCLIDDILDTDTYRAIIIPGGAQGVEELAANQTFIDILKTHVQQGAMIGAICAAPTILSRYKMLPANAAITSHPSVADQLTEYTYSTESVVRHQNFITSRGVGTAIDFSLAVIQDIVGSPMAQSVADSIVYSWNND